MHNVETMSSQDKNIQINNVNNNSSSISSAEKNALMKKLEIEGEQQLKNLQLKNKLTVDSLTDIMEGGFSEFKQKTGKNPTYAEMRAMYG
jgi:hypothetical protein